MRQRHQSEDIPIDLPRVVVAHQYHGLSGEADVSRSSRTEYIKSRVNPVG